MGGQGTAVFYRGGKPWWTKAVLKKTGEPPLQEAPNAQAAIRPKRPLLKSATAWRISSSLFITNGP